MSVDSKPARASPIPIPEDEPPPYTTSPDSGTPQSSVDAELGLIITIKLHRPSRLQNEHTGGRISRSGPERSSFFDAVLCPPTTSATTTTWSSFYTFMDRIRARAAERLDGSCTPACSSGLVERGKLSLQPSEHRDNGLVGTVRVDVGNWEAVRALLALGRGELIFEVVDVPKGWIVVGSAGHGPSRWSR